MTLADWGRKTVDRFRTLPPRTATKRTANEAALGALRRGVRLTKPGTPIWSREWDICCVLDGCRVDVFDELAPDLELNKTGAMWSVGSASPEWMDQTFKSDFAEEMSKTAYITANPFSAKPPERAASARTDALPLSADDFAHFEEVWKTDWTHKPVSTVEPQALTDRAIDVWRRRDGLGVERMIIHYMQPHIPFRSRPEWFGPREDLDAFGEPNKEAGKDPWKLVRDGDVSRGDFWSAYRDNLRWAFDDVELLAKNADATIALTSDHGNGLGEWGVWSHPPETPVPSVRRVPWGVMCGVDTGSYHPEPPGSRVQNTPSEQVTDRLAALGYK